MPLLRDFIRSYSDFHRAYAKISMQGIRLSDHKGNRIGYIEQLTFVSGGIRLEGWADVDTLSLFDEAGTEIKRISPYIFRADVQRALKTERNQYGFVMNVRTPSSRFAVTANRGDNSTTTRLPSVTGLTRTKNRLRVKRAYLATVIRIGPDILRWLRTRDPEVRRRLGVIFRTGDDNGRILDLAVFSAPSWPKVEAAPITIVMPIYRGEHLIDPALERLSRHTDLPWHLIVVDDASPDPAVAAKLAIWQHRLTATRMTLLRNDVNQGFIVSANRGLDLALGRGHDVVLLNSDAFVGPNWASRLLQPMIADRSIASVTPMSNEAEIANVPVISRAISLRPGEGDAIDRVASLLANTSAIADAPTGVGFCMAMNIDMLRRIPGFDPAFGRGYGEEVDWCQRARALGGRNVLNAGVFVEHFGAESFGIEEKQKLNLENGAKITRRYPDFDQQVQDFVANDPLLLQRIILSLTLGVERAKNRGRKLVVFLGHALGGGADTYLVQRIDKELRNTGMAVVVRPLPDGLWKIEVHTTKGNVVGLLSDPADLRRMFDFVSGLHIVYSCGVGAVDPLAIPRFLTQLANGTESSVEVAFNDYFPLSPSYTLMNRSGFYRELPLDSEDAAHRFVRADGRIVGLQEWQHEWTALIERADQLTVFSESSARIVAEAWPLYRDRIEVLPHRLPVFVPPIPAPAAARQTVIGVLGNISKAKGAEVLCDLSRELAKTGRGRLVLIGNLEPGHQLEKPSVAQSWATP